MLFTQLDACSHCYDPSVISIPKDHLISGMDCCRHIVHTVDYLMEHGCLDSDITGNPVHIVVSDIPEATLHRTAEDINRIVFYGKEFERKLALLGIHRIKQEQTLFYLRYLQMCYFLYLMDYIIYPDVRFFDLFKENNLSSENVSDAGTGNQKYQDMILQVILQHPQYRKLDDDYEHAFALFQDTFFTWYELSMYSYMENNQIQSDTGILPEQYLPDFSTYIHSRFSAFNSSVSIPLFQTGRSVFDDVLAVIRRKEAEAVLHDYGMNLDQTDTSFLYDLTGIISRTMPEEYEEEYITYEQIPLLEQDHDFLTLLKGNSKRRMPDERFIHTYQISSAVRNIWDFEADQLKADFTDGQFTFVQKEDEQYYMSMKHVFIICMIRVYLPQSVRYCSRRIILHDRSDGDRSSSRSIKQSFKAENSGDFHPADSALRNDVFRILCRAALCFVESSPEEFFHYELPMNRMLTEVLHLPEQLPYLEHRTAWFLSMTDVIHGDPASR